MRSVDKRSVELDGATSLHTFLFIPSLGPWWLFQLFSRREEASSVSRTKVEWKRGAKKKFLIRSEKENCIRQVVSEKKNLFILTGRSFFEDRFSLFFWNIFLPFAYHQMASAIFS